MEPVDKHFLYTFIVIQLIIDVIVAMKMGEFATSLSRAWLDIIQLWMLI